MSEWTIRNLLNPVITRLLIYGVNPIDLEYVLHVVENKNHINARSLERSWLAEWESKARRYSDLAEAAAAQGNSLSANEFFLFAAQCYYATFLINFADKQEKKRVYGEYARYYEKSVQYFSSPVQRLPVPLADGVELAGYLHRPAAGGAAPAPCVVIFAGLGSCKEEMHMLARPLVERGLAVFVPDMPGSGESLFVNDVKCRYAAVQLAFERILATLAQQPGIRPDGFGAMGLCMGGGYAYSAASRDARYRACVNLFPLFITQVAESATPQWMRQGDWYNYQTGGLPGADFMDEMRQLEAGALTCPYFMFHGRHDNWMTLNSAMALFEKAQGPKEKMIIEETPVFSTDQVVTHTMPVGEQLHWIRHVAADWINARLREG
jgi:dienelactone hydrolase